MAYAYPEVKNFLGLHSQQNTFTVPDGALEDARNIVISRDGVITKRRGFYEYCTPVSGTLNNLFLYQSRLIACFQASLAYLTDAGSSPNFTGTLTSLTGETVAVTGTRVARAVEASNNLYITSDNGVMKLEAYNSTITKAGAPPALDLRGSYLAVTGAGPITADCQVAWRYVLGRRDANDNLILGAPSDILTLTNAKVTGSVWSRTANVATVTSTAHGLVTGQVITVSNSAGGSPEVVSGDYTITVTTANAFTIVSTGSDDAAGNTLDYVVQRKARLEGSIPTEITSTTQGYFVQVYRSDMSVTSSASPTPNFKQLDERKLTAAEITAGHFVYDDDVSQILVDYATELYTNPNSREGELQANARPPLCDDVAFFKDHILYGAARTRHLLELQVVDPSQLGAGDYVEVKVDATTRRYVAREGVANQTVNAESVSGTTTITVTYTAHGLSTGDTVYISSITGTLTAGSYVVTVTGADTFTVTATSLTASALSFQGLTNGTYPIFKLDSSSSSVSTQLRNTAQGLVKAINRDTGSLVYARYTSAITDVPGKVTLQAKGFTGTIYLRANGTAEGAGFLPVLPSDFSAGDQVYSDDDDLGNCIFVSKPGEGEAVPLLNYVRVGPRNKRILRILALRDSVIVLSEAGVYRLNGDDYNTFVVTPLDTTIVCLVSSSAALLNNQVLCLTNQGVCLISDNAVQIVSRKIEDPMQAVLGQSTLSAQTAAVGYESDRLYLLTTLEPNDAAASVVYAYNVLNDTWTTTDALFKQALVGPSDTLYYIGTDGKIYKERKNNNRIDYCGQNYTATIVSVAVDKLSAVVSVSGTPTAGDALVKGSVFSKAVTSTIGDLGYYTLTFDQRTNLVAADSVQLYKKYDAQIKLAPFHAGLVGRMKQFAQMQVHTRDGSISRLKIVFASNVYGWSDELTWSAAAISQSVAGGFGNRPWGFFAWGEDDGINNTYGTQPATIIRVIVSAYHQRATFIQPILQHRVAGEPMNIQALAFAVRSYGERNTR